MSGAAVETTLRADDQGPHLGVPNEGLTKLAVGAAGVVFGDIGTSPLYALKTSLAGPHPLPVNPFYIMSVISLFFWSMIIVVTLKYVVVTMRADNKGEGGSLALLAMLSRRLPKGRRAAGLAMLGVLATALFYGDAMITPAISVLSAVEGLKTVAPGMSPLVIPLSLAIIVGLFLIQSRGTARVGALFGPIMLVYFAVIAVLGVINIVLAPRVLEAFSPTYAIAFFAHDPLLAFLALGSVVLAITGAEALYADMGHFGRKPISLAWLVLVLPCLMLNYMGQGALLIAHPNAITNPFFLMAPDALRLPLVILATVATVIASQAVISGAFSVTQQAAQLSFLPRVRVMHTSATAYGQIYVPLVNWLLMIFVLLLVVGFRSSDNLASAYGIAVTGTMFITTCMLSVLVLAVWKWNKLYAVPMLALFFVVDGAYFASNLTKIVDGGWFPLLVGLVVFTLLTTWAKGRQLVIARLREGAMPIEVFIRSARGSAQRVSGTAVFMTSIPAGVPDALLHNLKHNKVLHERVVILTVLIEEVPTVAAEQRVEYHDLGDNFYRIILRYGFMQEPDVPAALKLVQNCGPTFRMMDTSFFLARQTLLASDRPGMALWREKIFAWMLQNAETAMSFFKLPSNRVIELGSQVEI
jgi:KUP system potassium uptake protein